MTNTTNTADHRSLYEVTGDIKDINTMLVPRSTLAAPAQAVPAHGVPSDDMITAMLDGLHHARKVLNHHNLALECGPVNIAIAAASAPAAPAKAGDMTDAYAGAREDLSIWKKRALEAEALIRKFAASVNGSTFMGEPSAQAAPVDATVQQDAARYRWLKITAKPGEPYELLEKMREAQKLVRAYEQFCKPWNGWDATIDAARAAQGGHE